MPSEVNWWDDIKAIFGAVGGGGSTSQERTYSWSDGGQLNEDNRQLSGSTVANLHNPDAFHSTWYRWDSDSQRLVPYNGPIQIVRRYYADGTVTVSFTPGDHRYGGRLIPNSVDGTRFIMPPSVIEGEYQLPPGAQNFTMNQVENIVYSNINVNEDFVEQSGDGTIYSGTTDNKLLNKFSLNDYPNLIGMRQNGTPLPEDENVFLWIVYDNTSGRYVAMFTGPGMTPLQLSSDNGHSMLLDGVQSINFNYQADRGPGQPAQFTGTAYVIPDDRRYISANGQTINSGNITSFFMNKLHQTPTGDTQDQPDTPDQRSTVRDVDKFSYLNFYFFDAEGNPVPLTTTDGQFRMNYTYDPISGTYTVFTEINLGNGWKQVNVEGFDNFGFGIERTDIGRYTFNTQHEDSEGWFDQWFDSHFPPQQPPDDSGPSDQPDDTDVMFSNVYNASDYNLNFKQNGVQQFYVTYWVDADGNINYTFKNVDGNGDIFLDGDDTRVQSSIITGGVERSSYAYRVSNEDLGGDDFITWFNNTYIQGDDGSDDETEPGPPPNIPIIYDDGFPPSLVSKILSKGKIKAFILYKKKQNGIPIKPYFYEDQFQITGFIKHNMLGNENRIYKPNVYTEPEDEQPEAQPQPEGVSLPEDAPNGISLPEDAPNGISLPRDAPSARQFQLTINRELEAVRNEIVKFDEEGKLDENDKRKLYGLLHKSEEHVVHGERDLFEEDFNKLLDQIGVLKLRQFSNKKYTFTKFDPSPDPSSGGVRGATLPPDMNQYKSNLRELANKDFNDFKGSNALQIRAVFAGVSYLDPEDRPLDIMGHKLLTSVSGRRIATYRDPFTKNIIVSFRGTSEASDVIADIVQGVSVPSVYIPIIEENLRVFDKIIARYAAPSSGTRSATWRDETYELIGHSLGGLMASEAFKRHPQIKDKARVIGYNPAVDITLYNAVAGFGEWLVGIDVEESNKAEIPEFGHELYLRQTGDPVSKFIRRDKDRKVEFALDEVSDEPQLLPHTIDLFIGDNFRHLGFNRKKQKIIQEMLRTKDKKELEKLYEKLF